MPPSCMSCGPQLSTMLREISEAVIEAERRVIQSNPVVTLAQIFVGKTAWPLSMSVAGKRKIPGGLAS